MVEKGTNKPDAPRARKGSRADLNPVARYFQELRMEWNKITFPEWKELKRSTIVVFLFTTLVTIVVSIFDMVMTFIFKHLLPS